MAAFFLFDVLTASKLLNNVRYNVARRIYCQQGQFKKNEITFQVKNMLVMSVADEFRSPGGYLNS
jgi:hypothetical protein